MDTRDLDPDRFPAGVGFQLREVRKVYRSKSKRGVEVQTPALRGLSMDIDPGETVVIGGPSGSGKSTLLHILGGLDSPTSGRVMASCPDRSTDDDSRKWLELGQLDEDRRAVFRRNHVGFVHQAFHLIPTQACWENVALPLMLGGIGLEERRRRAVERLREIGLEDKVESYPEDLSGGQRQRVAIARALACDPGALMADEPTGNLDTASADQFLDLVDEIRGSRRLTVILVTHDHRIAGRLACRRILIKDGMVDVEGGIRLE